MGERHHCRHLAVGAGAPAGPDQAAEEPAAPSDVVQAVAEFVEDLVEEEEEPPGEGDG